MTKKWLMLVFILVLALVFAGCEGVQEAAKDNSELASVAGKIVMPMDKENIPLEGVLVEIAGVSVFTDSAGDFTVPRVPYGTHQLTASGVDAINHLPYQTISIEVDVSAETVDENGLVNLGELATQYDLSAMENAFYTWVEGYNEKNIDKVMALFPEDKNALIKHPASTMDMSVYDLRNMYEQIFDYYDAIDVSYSNFEIFLDQGVIVINVTLNAQGTYTDPKSGDQKTEPLYEDGEKRFIFGFDQAGSYEWRVYEIENVGFSI